jgi:hypothetical protein
MLSRLWHPALRCSFCTRQKIDLNHRSSGDNDSSNPHPQAETQRWTFNSSCMSPPAEPANSADHTPKIGYGAGTAWFKRKDPGFNRELVEATKIAIELGYRHLDGAEGPLPNGSITIAVLE